MLKRSTSRLIVRPAISLVLKQATTSSSSAYHVAMTQRIGSIFDVKDKSSNESNDNDIFKSLTQAFEDESNTNQNKRPSSKRQQQQQKETSSPSSVLMRSIFEELKSTNDTTSTQKTTASASANEASKFAFDAFLFGDSKMDTSSLQTAASSQGSLPKPAQQESFYLGQKILYEDPTTYEIFVEGQIKLISKALQKVSAERIETVSKETIKMVELLRSENGNLKEMESVFLSIEKPSVDDFSLLARAYSKDVSKRIGVKNSFKQLKDSQSFGTVLLQTYAKLGQTDSMNEVLEQVKPDVLVYISLLKNLKEMRASFETLRNFCETIPEDLKEEGSFIYETLKREEKINDMENILMKEGAPVEGTYFNAFVTPVIGYNRPHPK